MKKMIRLLALMLLVVICLSACAKENPQGGETSDTTTPDAEESTTSADGTEGTTEGNNSDKKPAEKLAAANALQIANKKKTSYTIVLDNSLKNSQKNVVETFRSRLSDKMGATMKMANDNEDPTEKEILVYAMDGRKEVEEVLGKLTAPEKRGYRIEVSDSKIIVACDQPIYLAPALELLYDAIRECDDGSFGIEKDYVGKLDLPTPVAGSMSQTTSVYTEQSNYTVTVHNASKTNYSKFTKSLNNDGFYTYDSHSMGSASFATYVKDSFYGKQAVYTMYYPDDQCYKVTYGPLGYLPELRASTNKVVTPFFSQPQTASGGLRTVMRLENGEFIVFDGGNASGTDQKYLLNFLKEHSPSGTPTIAAWVITHAHGDHLGMANNFLADYSKEINLKMVIYNFPDWENSELRWDFSQGDTGSMKGLATRFKSILAEQYPNTKQWVVHTGQTMQLPGCEIQVLYTPEDYASGIGLQKDGSISFPSGNSTNIALRLTINGTTIVTPGDSEDELCRWMGATYGEDLKSDVLYLTHHGYNGGELNFYRMIDPDICIWPTTPSGMSEYIPMFDYNKYLMNLHPTYPGRDRVHHTQDKETIYEITEDGPKLTVGTPAQYN